MADQDDDSISEATSESEIPDEPPWDVDLEKFDYSLDYIVYPTLDDIVSIHDDIIDEDEDASPGVLNDGHVDFALNYIQHGHYGEVPDSIHEKAYRLMKLLAANHAFADGNKRTALNTTWTFYAMNGYYFSYGEEIKAVLKLLAVKQEMVDDGEVISYFGDIAFDEESERAPSELIKIQHLFSCYEDMGGRTQAFVEDFEGGTLEDGTIQDAADRFRELIEKTIHITSGFVQYRNEFGDELPDEMVAFIDGMHESTDQLLNMMGEIAQVEADSDEAALERTEEILSKYRQSSEN